MKLSLRGETLRQEAPPLVKAHFQCKTDPYHPEKNPNGYINFGTAENHLLWDVVKPVLERPLAIDEAVAHYDYMYGMADFRQGVAHLLERHFPGGNVNPDGIVIASGSSSILDMLATVICNPGDGVLLPAPYYSGFNVDLMKSGAVPIPVPLSSHDGFTLTAAKVGEKLAQCRATGQPVSALLLASPQNPLGTVYSKSLLLDLIALCDRENLHCVIDEIYANSVFGKSEFVSALALISKTQQNVHFVYGFAKDFGLSGFKTGIGYSQNQSLVEAMRALCYFSPVSNHMQRVLTELVNDETFLATLFKENRKRLETAYLLTTGVLKSLGAPYTEASAGIFLLVNFGKLAAVKTFSDEQKLWRRFFEEARVSMSPGEVFACPEPGWFRLCFAQKPESLSAGLGRVVKLLARR